MLNFKFSVNKKEQKMPELPSVQRFSNYLTSTALNKKIDRVVVKDKSLLENTSAQTFQKKLKDEKFRSVNRHGKYLLVSYKKKENLYFHFGMTGKFKYYKEQEEPKYAKVIFNFSNGYHMAFICPRKLGEVGLTGTGEDFSKDKKLGPDALDKELTFEKFHDIFSHGRGAIKSSLMNQKKIAGIGNIFSDEFLFQASVNPQRKCSAIKENEYKDIYKNMQKILKKQWV